MRISLSRAVSDSMPRRPSHASEVLCAVVVYASKSKFLSVGCCLMIDGSGGSGLAGASFAQGARHAGPPLRL